MAHSNRNTLGGKGRARVVRNQRGSMPVQPGAKANPPKGAPPEVAARIAKQTLGKTSIKTSPD